MQDIYVILGDIKFKWTVVESINHTCMQEAGTIGARAVVRLCHELLMVRGPTVDPTIAGGSSRTQVVELSKKSARPGWVPSAWRQLSQVGGGNTRALTVS